ncbi:MAG: hypothetical protein CML67_01965 [Rhodobacteraceae bacterium]|nr:hypothetical protein [Paracoccaceae bacterium]
MTRSPPPAHAETFPAHDFMRAVYVPSRILPGKEVCRRKQTCPLCGGDTSISHGERVTHDCGLTMELWGNALTIWKGDAP